MTTSFFILSTQTKFKKRSWYHRDPFTQVPGSGFVRKTTSPAQGRTRNRPFTSSFYRRPANQPFPPHTTGLFQKSAVCVIPTPHPAAPQLGWFRKKPHPLPKGAQETGPLRHPLSAASQAFPTPHDRPVSKTGRLRHPDPSPRPTPHWVGSAKNHIPCPRAHKKPALYVILLSAASQAFPPPTKRTRVPPPKPYAGRRARTATRNDQICKRYLSVE